jgi:hypothetical protein
MTPIGSRRKRLNPIFIVCCVLVLVLVLAGCGSDDEKSATSAPDTATATTETDRSTDTESPEAATEPTEGSPEDQPGGAGDEEPAYSQAVFTGRNGRITPSVIRVPPFISIRVVLRSADGGQYGLTFAGHALKVEGALSYVSTTLDGMRAGGAVVGTPLSAGNGVRIEANAEPGP